MSDRAAAARRLRVLLLGLLLGAEAVAAPPPAVAQDAPVDPEEDVSPLVPPEPPAAEAPLQFAVGPALATLRWEDATPERPEVDDATMIGLSVESRVLDFFGIRFDAAYGRTRLVADGDATEDVQATDANQYLIDLSLVGRAAFAPLEAVGVVPFVTVGAGSVVHDPEADGLITRSQSAFTYGAGFDVRLVDRLGGRLEWRRHDVSFEDAFADGTQRSGRTVSVDRFAAVLYLRL